MPDVDVTTDEGGRKQVEIDRHPDQCPLCHYGIEARFQGLAYVNEKYNRRLELIFQCPRETCRSLFISRYFQYPYTDRYNYSGSFPFEPDPRNFSEHISKISPKFCEIFTESENAEHTGWKLIAGPGHRKALEFGQGLFVPATSGRRGRDKNIAACSLHREFC